MATPQPDVIIRVLLVDDEATLLDLTKIFLEQSEDITAVTVESGEEALEMLSTEVFDAVVSDYQMPSMDGIELLKRIRDQASNVPFILFTGKGREEMVIEALNNGADFFLQKGGDPVSMYTELSHHIRSMVRERRAQEGLRLSELKFKKVFDVSFVALSLTDEEGRIIEWNRRAEEITGLRASEVMGRFIWEVQFDTALPEDRTPEHLETLRRMFEDALERGVPLDEQGKATEGTCLHQDGYPVYLSQQVFTISTSKGNMVYTVAWETTQYRKAVQEALEHEAKYRAILDEISDIILVFTIDPSDPIKLHYIEMNEEARRRLGYELDELDEADISRIIDMGGHEGLIAKNRKLLEEGSISFETVFQSKDGSTFQAEVTNRLVSLGDINGVVVVARDIAHEKQHREEGLKKAYDQINLLSQITRHDIKNQIMVGKGYLSLIESTVKDEGARKNIKNLSTALSNIERQIDFTRAYQDLGSTLPSWQKVLDIIGTIPNKSSVPHLEIGKGLRDLEVFADPMIEKVFYNLVENTVRYGGRPPQVHIDAAPRGDCLMIIYEDVGPGVPAREKELIFKKGHGKGTGLGLFLSRNILALTGIKITETGEPGKGARFEICVPADKHRYAVS